MVGRELGGVILDSEHHLWTDRQSSSLEWFDVASEDGGRVGEEGKSAYAS